MLRLLDELGIDPEHFVWQELANCRNLEVNWFYDDYEADQVVAKNATQVCLDCPVLKSCFSAGEDNKEEGLWGGVYRNSAGKIDSIRNKNKTDDEWQLLESKIGKRIRNGK